jgi:Rieske Fe-S protein
MERRTFLKWCTHGLGAFFGVILGAPAIAYLLDARNRQTPDREFRTVARLSELEIGKPKEVVLRDVRSDAWTLHPNDIVGRVWLVRRDQAKVDVYTSICPHLGCSINYHPAASDQDKRFICPCHGGIWDFDGKRVNPAANVAPRDMDTLVKEEQPDPSNLVDGKPDTLIRVKYQRFKQSDEKKIVIG